MKSHGFGGRSAFPATDAGVVWVGVKKIEASPIEQLVSTDLVTNPSIVGSGKIKIVPVAPLFADVYERTDTPREVSVLALLKITC